MEGLTKVVERVIDKLHEKYEVLLDIEDVLQETACVALENYDDDEKKWIRNTYMAIRKWYAAELNRRDTVQVGIDDIAIDYGTFEHPHQAANILDRELANIKAPPLYIEAFRMYHGLIENPRGTFELTTYDEVAIHFGRSRERIRQYVVRTERRLRNRYHCNLIPEFERPSYLSWGEHKDAPLFMRIYHGMNWVTVYNVLYAEVRYAYRPKEMKHAIKVISDYLTYAHDNTCHYAEFYYAIHDGYLFVGVEYRGEQLICKYTRFEVMNERADTKALLADLIQRYEDEKKGHRA